MTSWIVLVWFGQKYFRHIRSHIVIISFIGHRWSMTSTAVISVPSFLSWLGSPILKPSCLRRRSDTSVCTVQNAFLSGPTAVICIHLDPFHTRMLLNQTHDLLPNPGDMNGPIRKFAIGKQPRQVCLILQISLRNAITTISCDVVQFLPKHVDST